MGVNWEFFEFKHSRFLSDKKRERRADKKRSLLKKSDIRLEQTIVTYFVYQHEIAEEKTNALIAQ